MSIISVLRRRHSWSAISSLPDALASQTRVPSPTEVARDLVHRDRARVRPRPGDNPTVIQPGRGANSLRPRSSQLDALAWSGRRHRDIGMPSSAPLRRSSKRTAQNAQLNTRAVANTRSPHPQACDCQAFVRSPLLSDDHGHDIRTAGQAERAFTNVSTLPPSMSGLLLGRFGAP